MVKTAIEGRKKIDEVRSTLRTLPFNPDLLKLLKNCENICTEVSKKEVLDRNTKHGSHTEKPLKDLNDALDRLEKLILIAKLMA
jgi:hypothetical protein